MRPQSVAAVSRESRQDRNLADGFAYLRNAELPRTLLLVTGAFSVFGFSFVAMLPVYARDVLHAGATGYSALMSAFGVGAAGGALSMAAVGGERRNPVVIRWAGLVFGLCLAGLGLVAHFPSAVLLLIVAGAGMILNNVITNTLLQTTTPDHLRGRVMGFYSLVVLGLAPLGNLLIGWAAETMGVETAVGLGGIVCVIATLFGTRRIAELASQRVDGLVD
jgi:hypothetical protein